MFLDSFSTVLQHKKHIFISQIFFFASRFDISYFFEESCDKSEIDQFSLATIKKAFGDEPGVFITDEEIFQVLLPFRFTY